MSILAGNFRISSWQHVLRRAGWKTGNKDLGLSFEISNFLWHINTFQAFWDIFNSCNKNLSLSAPREIFPTGIFRLIIQNSHFIIKFWFLYTWFTCVIKLPIYYLCHIHLQITLIYTVLYNKQLLQHFFF